MNNNPPQPTRKTVKRPNQRGARIHPRGCRVRYILNNDGTLGKNAKATGLRKPAKKTIVIEGDRHFEFNARVGESRSTRFLWDTGATSTSISQKTARKLGLLGQDNQPINGYRWGRDIFAEIASGEVRRIKTIDNVPLTFADYAQETVTGLVTIAQDETSSSLFGVNMIRKVKTLKIKNK